MKKEDLENLILKYRRKSQQFRRYSEEKCYFFEDIADDIETNFEIYLDDFYETEEDVLEGVQMDIDARDASWMFDGDEDN